MEREWKMTPKLGIYFGRFIGMGFGAQMNTNTSFLRSLRYPALETTGNLGLRLVVA